MKPGDIAIIMCKRHPLHMKVALLIEHIDKMSLQPNRSGWLCLVDGKQRTINSGWMKRIKDDN